MRFEMAVRLSVSPVSSHQVLQRQDPGHARSPCVPESSLGHSPTYFVALAGLYDEVAISPSLRRTLRSILQPPQLFSTLCGGRTSERFLADVVTDATRHVMSPSQPYPGDASACFLRTSSTLRLRHVLHEVLSSRLHLDMSYAQ